MPEQYTVKSGDCLSSIAEDFGFADYRSIYDDASNADFRKLRPNPNLIYPGDVINIPDKDGKFDDKGTGAAHHYKARATKRYLNLRLLENDRDPLANKRFKLTCAGEVHESSTDGNGKLKIRIPRRAKKATLEIEGFTWDLDIANLNPIEDTDDDGVSGYQSRLKNLGYDPGPIDGICGPRTRAAVRAFQEDNPPLEVDGICGPKTKAKLAEMHGS
jgi:hypothetical protein